MVQLIDENIKCVEKIPVAVQNDSGYKKPILFYFSRI